MTESTVINKGTEVGKSESMTLKELNRQNKKQEKLDKQRRDYWNGMITRQEAKQLVDKALERQVQKMRVLYVANQAILDLLMDKNILTKDEIVQKNSEIIRQIYGLKEEKEKI